MILSKHYQLKNEVIFMLILDDIVKIYQHKNTKNYRLTVLRGVNLQVNPMDVIFITGRSGSGKSTLLHIISKLDSPTAGKILFNDINYSNLRGKTLLRFRSKNIGILFQNPLDNLHLNLSVEENIRLPMKISRELPPKSQNLKVVELLKKVDILDKRYSKISELSGGERQRVALCCCLANDPDIILADEPTGELDIQNSTFLIELLRDLCKKLNSSAIIVTHNESLIKSNDLHYHLENGILSRII